MRCKLKIEGVSGVLQRLYQVLGVKVLNLGCMHENLGSETILEESLAEYLLVS